MALPSCPPDPPPSTATTAAPRFLTSPSSPSRDHPRPPPPATSSHPQSHLHHQPYQPPPHSQCLYAAQSFSNVVPRVHTSTNSIHHQLAPRPPLHYDPTQPHHQGLLYPVASSGRGFLQKAIPTQSVINHGGGFLPQPVAAYPQSVRLFAFAHSDPSLGQPQTVHLTRPNHLQQTLLGSSGNVVPGVVKGVPVANSSSVSDCNGIKDSRERGRDDSFVTIRDRKVRISEATSIYALSRSWLRNGFHEETQPEYMEGVKSLPSPFPVPLEDAYSPVKKESDKDEEEDEEYIERLSPQELLQRHVKRAKKVRARLREERLQRIARYKTRLALLLPPNVEQQFRNETATRN